MNFLYYQGIHNLLKKNGLNQILHEVNQILL
jgi:hypothetical protein